MVHSNLNCNSIICDLVICRASIASEFQIQLTWFDSYG